MTQRSLDPATGRLLAEFQECDSEAVDAALERAHRAFLAWRETDLGERVAYQHRLAGYLRDHKTRLAGLITSEMGKPIVEAEAEIEKCAWACAYFADHAGRLLATQPIATDAQDSYVRFDPLGPILAIMPWNFPFWQVFRHAAPTLMAGNTIVLKHAPNVPRCALAIEEAFTQSGYPDSILIAVLAATDAVERMIADRRTVAVTLTGSVRAGRVVAALAGQYLKKSVLELGGSDPFIVLADADLDGALTCAVRGRYQNAGQSCIAAKRFILAEDIADEFTCRFVAMVQALHVGAPMSRETQIGPLARADLRETLERQVRESVAAGAVVRTGGARLDGPGYYYAPTVLTDVRRDMAVWREEVFGPVAPVVAVSSPDEAVAVANDSAYGLGASIWSRDTERGREMARRIASGNVFVNGVTASDPRLPFGGVRDSGYGRELSSFGIHEFVNVKTVWIG